MIEWIKRLFSNKEAKVHPAIYRQACASNHGALLNFINSNPKLKIKTKKTSGSYVIYSNQLMSGYGLRTLTTLHDTKGKIVHFTL